MIVDSRSDIFQRACEVIPGGVSSPLRSFRKVGGSPFVVKEAKEDLLIDSEGKEYIDFCLGNGSILLGHTPFSVKRGLQDISNQGLCYGTAFLEEEKLARKLLSYFPSMQKVRFFPSGTEAVMTAIRLARSFTQRKKILKFSGGYHGHYDALLVQAGSEVGSLQASSSGILQESISSTLVLPYNQIEPLENLFLQEKGQIAAILVEPVATNMGLVPASPAFLKALRELSYQAGSVLIFDEIVTGFRLGLSGAQGLYQVEPDLTCLGKILGGGAPCGALGGKKQIMDLLAPLGPVFHAGTFAAHPLAIRLGLAALQELEKPGFYEELEEKASLFLDPIHPALEKKRGPHSLVRMASLFSFFWGISPPTSFEEVEKQDTALFQQFFHHLFAKNIFLQPSYYEVHFLSQAHTQEHLLFAQEEILNFIEKRL